MITWLRGNQPFPPVQQALREPNGLLAAGGDLSPERLLDAYRHGIFPWYSDDEPILWWSPDPRMVLFPAELKVSRSLSKTLRNTAYEIRFDSAFDAVMMACAAPRPTQAGTWITDQMRAAYNRLHRMGHAHSVETWAEGALVGGLYGVALGGIFFGESMFSRHRDASKLALVALVRKLQADGFGLIDCQLPTPHLESLGARAIRRSDFIRRVRELIHYPETPGSWSQAGFSNEPPSPCRS
jgi:leucyl/phenylalanyl-tRNA---protein transferase